MAAGNYKTAGAFASSGNSVSASWPASGYVAGDMGILVIGTAAEGYNSTISGWIKVGHATTGTGAAIGAVAVTVYKRIAESGAEPAAVVGDWGNHTTAQIFVFEGPCDVNVYATAVQATASANWTLPGVTTTTDGETVVLCIGNDRDLAGTTNLSGWTNANLTGLTERADQTIATGVGGGIGVATGVKTTAGATGTTSVTNGASNTAAFLTLSLKARIAATLTKGYAAGGTTTSVYNSKIEGFSFPSETIGTIAYSLGTPVYLGAGISDGYFGYCCGGTIGATQSTAEIDGIKYSDESASNPSTSLSLARSGGAGVSGIYYGLVGGGFSDLSSTYFGTIDGMFYSTHAAITASGALVSNRSTACGAHGTYIGYFFGGSTGSPSSEIDGVVFSTTAQRNPAATLSSAEFGVFGFSSGNTAAYVAGGKFGPTNIIRKFTLATEALATISATLSVARGSGSSATSSTTGYAIGGEVNITRQSEIDGLTISTETATNPSAALGTATKFAAGFSGNGPTTSVHTAGVTETASADDGKDYTYSAGASVQDEPASAVDQAGVFSPFYAEGLFFAGENYTYLSQVYMSADGVKFTTDTIFSPSLTISHQSTNYSKRGSGGQAGTGYVFGRDITHKYSFSYSSLGGISASLGNTNYTSASVFSSTTHVIVVGATASNAQKVDFSTDSISSFSSALPREVAGTAATSNYNGYLFGGSTAIVIRYTFGTDVASDISGTLSYGIAVPAASQSATDGYTFGGTYSGVTYSTISAVSFSTESVSLIGNMIVADKWGFSAAQSELAAYLPHSYYVAGGYAGSVDKFDFPTASSSLLSSSLQRYRHHYGAISGTAAGLYPYTVASAKATDHLVARVPNISNAVISGGAGMSGGESTVNGFYFSTEVVYNGNTAFENPRYYACGNVSNLASGYIAGGARVSDAQETQTINSVSFQDVSVGPVSATLTSATGMSGGFSSSTSGYWHHAAFGTAVNAFRMTTQTVVSLSSRVQVARLASGGVQSSTNGYYLGGYNSGGSTNSSEIDGILFSDETATNPAATLVTARSYGAALSSPTSGYLLGGYLTSSPFYSSEIDGIVFATQASNNPAAALGTARRDQAGVYSTTAGYACGGADAGYYKSSEIIKFLFSTEAASTTSAYLTTMRYGASGVSAKPTQGTIIGDTFEDAYAKDVFDSLFGAQANAHTATAVASHADTAAKTAFGDGAVIGGSNGSSVLQTAIDVFHFYDNTVTAAAANLSVAMAGATNANGANTGYYVGGNYSGVGVQDDVQSWSFDNSSYSATSNTISARYRLASTQSSNKAFFAGGLNPANASVTEVDAIALPSGTSSNPAAVLSSARRSLAGMSSTTKGYYAGGENEVPTVMTGIEALTFSGESMATLSETLDDPRRRQGSVTNASGAVGYLFAGADATFSYDWIDKLTFGTETMSPVSGNLAAAKTEPATLESSTHGYILGGWTNTTVVTNDIESFAFSNETVGNPTSTLATERGTSAGISQINNTIQAGSAAEPGSATAAHDATGSQSISQSEQGTATAAHDALAAYLLSITEAGAATDAPSAVFSYAVAFLADTSSDDTRSALFTLLGSKTEPLTATDTETVTAAFVSAQTEPGTADDTKTVATAFVSSDTETASAADAPSSVYTTASSTTEPGTAGDAKDSVQVQPVSSTEPTAADDAKTVQTVFVSAESESATAVDAPAGTYTTASTQTETAAPTDAESATAAFVGSTTEPGTALDANDGISGATAAQDEAGSAADTKTVQAAFVSAADEPSAATAAQDFIYLATATITEVGTAGSSEIGIYAASISHSETATANALHDGSTIVGGTTHNVDQTEAGASGEEESVTAILIGSANETAGGTDTPTASAVFVTDASESATSSEDTSVVRSMDSDTAEPGNAADQSNFISANLAAISESGAAVDAGYGTYVTAVSITDSATALAEQAYAAIKYAVQEENGLAVDFSDSTITFFVSNDETAAAFDLSSVQSVFVVSFAADGQAAAVESAAADFIASITEAAAAVSAAARWLAGSEFVKTTTVFVATTSDGRLVCYLKPTPKVVTSKNESASFVEQAGQCIVSERKVTAAFVTKDPEA